MTVATRKFSQFPAGELDEAVGLAGDVNTRGDVTGGGGSVTEVITQDTTDLAVGRWVRFDEPTNLYVHALADTPENAEVAGVVLNILNATQFTLQQAGFIESGTPGFDGFTVGIYFLSDTMLGGQTLTIPTENGFVNKPVFSATAADRGEVICLSRGAVVGSPGPIPASGGGGSDSNFHTVTQPGNTFGIGDWVYVSGDTTYSRAIATTLAPSQSVGVVTTNGDPDFIIQFAGFNSNTVTGAVDSVGDPVAIVSGTTYYLSEIEPGQICPTSPLAATSYSKPVFTSESHTSGTGFVLPQRPLRAIDVGSNPNVIPVNQPGHPFGNGDVARVSGVNTYDKAQADSAANSLAVGFVEYVDADNFILHTAGYSDLFVAPFTPLVAGVRYFLSQTIAGGIDAVEPTGAGEYSVPMLIGLNATTGYILEQRPLSTAVLNPSENVFLGYLNAANNFQSATILQNGLGNTFNAYFILVERGSNAITNGINGTSGGPNVGVGFQIFMNGSWSTAQTYGVIGGGYQTTSNTNVATAWGMGYTGSPPFSADNMFILPPTSDDVSLNSGYGFLCVGSNQITMNFNMFCKDYSNLPVNSIGYTSIGVADDTRIGTVTGLRVYFYNGVLTPGSNARIAVYGIPNA